MSDTPWRSVFTDPPPNGIPVQTKIDHGNGERNVRTLKRSGSLWFFPDESTFTYCEPTHWRVFKEVNRGYTEFDSKTTEWRWKDE